MSPQEFFCQLSLWIGNLYLTYILHHAPLCNPIFMYMCGSESVPVFGMRIRILKAPKYGFNTDPDPQHWGKV